jgi:hypothetical protein
MALQLGITTASTASAPSFATDYTFMSWVRCDAIAFNNLWAVSGSVGNDFNLDGISIPANGHLEVSIKVNNISSFTFVEGTTALSNNTWYHITQRRSGNTLALFLGTIGGSSTTEVQTGPLDISGRTVAASTIILGGWGSSSDDDFQFFGAKAFSNALTLQQIQNEQYRVSPAQTPWAYWPFLDENALDWSGNSRSFSSTNAVAFNSPPITYGAPSVPSVLVTSAATATVNWDSGQFCFSAYQMAFQAGAAPDPPPQVAASIGFVEPFGCRTSTAIVDRFAIGNVEDR